MAANGEFSVLGGDENIETSLLEILDHVLNSGVVIHGSLVISVAGVDLVFVGLNVILTSIETALRNMNKAALREAEGSHAATISGALESQTLLRKARREP